MWRVACAVAAPGAETVRVYRWLPDLHQRRRLDTALWLAKLPGSATRPKLGIPQIWDSGTWSRNGEILRLSVVRVTVIGTPGRRKMQGCLATSV